MADKTELKARLEFRRAALEKLRAAYLALVDGGVKSYTLENRIITRLDLPALKREIEEAERQMDELESLLTDSRPRRAIGIVPWDW